MTYGREDLNRNICKRIVKVEEGPMFVDLVGFRVATARVKHN